jgi:hypothetical protein
MIAVRTIAAVLCLTMTAPVLAEESYPKVPKMFTSKGFVEFYGSNREHELAKVYVHGLLDGPVTQTSWLEKTPGGSCSAGQSITRLSRTSL